MRRASIIYQRFRENHLFAMGGGDLSRQFHLPFTRLRELFLDREIELNTPDCNAGHEVLFELHINVQRRSPRAPGYVYQYENALVRPRNEDPAALRRYQKVFTWNPALVQSLGHQPGPVPRAVLLPYPNRLTPAPAPAGALRPKGCVMVASNKSLAVQDRRDLHARRCEIIRAFEAAAPDFFSLYGRGWEYAPAAPGKWGRLLGSLRKRLPAPARSPFPSWRGPIADKDALLREAKFCICYENAADIPGYITEKIFDCMRTGCVPVYWGPKEVAEVIPSGCFVDARIFSHAHAIVGHLLTMGEKERTQLQHAAAEFIRSGAAAIFSEENFARTLVREISADFP